MQISFKILLDTRYIKKNQTYCLKLRVYQEENYKDCSLGINISLNDWNEQLQMVSFSNVNHQIYNTKLARIKAKVYKCILFNEDEDVIITPSEIIDQIKRIDKRRTVALKPDILKYGREHV
jgi:Arm DNA-binding domain